MRSLVEVMEGEGYLQENRLEEKLEEDGRKNEEYQKSSSGDRHLSRRIPSVEADRRQTGMQQRNHLKIPRTEGLGFSLKRLSECPAKWKKKEPPQSTESGMSKYKQLESRMT